MFSKDRLIRRGGGIIVYINNSIKCLEIQNSVSKDVEVLLLKLQPECKSVTNLCIVYRPQTNVRWMIKECMPN